MERVVTVSFEYRDDGGLRAWSDDVPGLVLSHSRPNLVMLDVLPALAEMGFGPPDTPKE